MFLHPLIVKGLGAVNAPLGGETAVRFDDLVTWHACAPLEGINILRKAGVEEALLSEQPDK